MCGHLSSTVLLIIKKNGSWKSANASVDAGTSLKKTYSKSDGKIERIRGYTT